jgi:threonine dehydrogenase-like Zn-dependent dehydrogenase
MSTLITTQPLATNKQFPKVESRKDPNKPMNALEWKGTEDVQVVQRPKPLITEPTDVIVRITSTTICGSDLHLYHNEVPSFKEPAMQRGDVLGHEGMGIVEETGSQVSNFKKGDRVVISAVISCGKCFYCKKQLFSLCDDTNPSMDLEALYGHRLSGIFGYSHLCGGFDGCQAEYVRVPIGDVNLLKIPSNLTDEQVIFLSDIACTGFHATELGKVKEGQTVAIWGCGPVGLMAVMWSKFKKASKVYAIDSEPYRLEQARKLGAEPINFQGKDIPTTLRTLCPGGPDVCIECAGFRFPKTQAHKLQKENKTETDAPEILTEMILSCRKGGNISIIGDYFGNTNNFPIGAMMEKNLRVTGGQVFVQKYWRQILEWIEKGQVDLTWVVTHKLPFLEAAKGYKMFDKHEDHVLKIILKTPIAH